MRLHFHRGKAGGSGDRWRQCDTEHFEFDYIGGHQYWSESLFDPQSFHRIGHHLLCAGKAEHQRQYSFQRVQFNDDLALSQYGQAAFSSLETFLQGMVSTFTAVPSPTGMDWRSLESAAFVQDQIRFSPRFSLSLGFRYEGTTGWNEAHGRASTFLVGPNGVPETTPRISSSTFTVNRAKFLPQPRAGFAWDALGSDQSRSLAAASGCTTICRMRWDTAPIRTRPSTRP